MEQQQQQLRNDFAHAVNHITHNLDQRDKALAYLILKPILDAVKRSAPTVILREDQDAGGTLEDQGDRNDAIN